jgi:hypothetical protein
MLFLLNSFLLSAGRSSLAESLWLMEFRPGGKGRLQKELASLRILAMEVNDSKSR